MSIFALGPRGTNGHEAAISLSRFLDMPIELCPNNTSILEMVRKKGGYGVVPIENGQAGLVSEVVMFWLAQLTQTRMNRPHVIGSIELPIQHALAVHNEVKTVSEITEVVSHPQALAQCRGFITRNRLKERSATSTAAAIAEVDTSQDSSIAAIGSPLAAGLYGLNVLFEDIQDSTFNQTRFHVVGEKPSKRPGEPGPHETNEHSGRPPLFQIMEQAELEGRERTAVIFQIANEPGKLAEIVQTIASHGVNLASLHSIPLGMLERYAFYCEFDCHWHDKDGHEILKVITRSTDHHCVLGSYVI